MSLVVPNYVKSKRNFISDEFCHFCSVAFLIDELGLFSLSKETHPPCSLLFLGNLLSSSEILFFTFPVIELA